MLKNDRSEKMTERLKRRGYLSTIKVIEAFRKVPRHKFLPDEEEKNAYVDRPLPIGRGQTISAPSMIAIMLEVIQLEECDKVLEIGTGSGYNAALIAEIIGEEGELYTIERLEEIAEVGRKNLKKTGYDRVNVIIGDGTKGYPEESPWDKIIVTACAPEIPDSLIDQLEIEGKLVAPVGQDYMSQILILLEKIGEDETKIEKHGGCAFVPLIGEDGWSEEQA